MRRRWSGGRKGKREISAGRVRPANRVTPGYKNRKSYLYRALLSTNESDRMRTATVTRDSVPPPLSSHPFSSDVPSRRRNQPECCCSSHDNIITIECRLSIRYVDYRVIRKKYLLSSTEQLAIIALRTK